MTPGEMQSAKELVGSGEPTRFLAIDPGKRCGLLYWTQGSYDTNTATLDELPEWLYSHVADSAFPLDFVAIEAFSLTGGNRRNDPSMPSSQGIGMARMACHAAGIPLYVVQRTSKRAGHQSLDAAGLAAWQSARNDHERDAVDIAGFVLREARR